MIDNDSGEIITGDVPRNAPFIRTGFNYDMNLASDLTGLHCPEETLAQQSAKEDADINTLVKRFGITGQMPVLERIPLMDDFTDIGDFKTAMDRIIEAQDVFMTMPADVRARFQNDPQQFLEFTSDEKNRDEMQKMGMLKPKPQDPEPMAVRVIQDPPAKGDPVT